MSDGSVFDRAAGFVVQVEDTITAALAGHDGCTYQSPPQPRDEAMSLIRILLGRSEEPPVDERGPLDLPDRRRPAHGHARAGLLARQLTPAPSRRDRAEAPARPVPLAHPFHLFTDGGDL